MFDKEQEKRMAEEKLLDIIILMETDDMMASHGEYEPFFLEGALWIGDFPEND